MATDKQYYYLDAQRQTIGPKSIIELKDMVAAGEINGQTLVACKGDAQWLPLETYLVEGPVGACPRCHTELEATDEGRVPAVCPHCGFKLTAPDGVWKSFVYTLCSKFCCFKGRATRKEYWTFYLVLYAVNMLLNITLEIIRRLVLGFNANSKVAEVLDLEDPAPGQLKESLLTAYGYISESMAGSSAAYVACLVLFFVQWAVSLVTWVPFMAATTRRLHDTGRTAASMWLTYGFMVISIISIFTFLSQMAGEYGMAASVVSADVPVVPLTSVACTMVFGLGFMVSGIYLLVMMFLDSKRGANKYGPSSKYPKA